VSKQVINKLRSLGGGKRTGQKHQLVIDDFAMKKARKGKL